MKLASRESIAVAIALGAIVCSARSASAAGVQVFTANLTGAQQVPAVTSSGTGTGTVVLNAAETQITVNLTFSGLSSAANGAHIHSGAAGTNGTILFDLTSVTPAATSGTIPEQTFTISPAQVADLRAGLFYFNIHTATNGGGEIRGQIGFAAVQYSVTLSGAQQAPAVTGAGTGTGTVALNAAQDKMFVNLSFSGLSSPAIMAHIHTGARGTNGAILFDFTSVTPGATSGSIPQQTFAITPAQVTDLKAGLFYFNIHTTNNPGGEIRGQIEASGPTVTLDRTALTFGATSNGTALTSQTATQTIRLTQSAGAQITFSATSNRPWLTVTPTFGYGTSALGVAVKFDSSLPASGTVTGTISIALSGAGTAAVGPINVTLNVVSSTAAASPPFGSFDTPAGDATVLAGSIAVTGWTLDNIGVKQVELWRDLQPGETTPPGNSTPGDPRNGKIFIANATFVDNARPDVEGLNPTIPANYRAGWGYLMLTWGLFGQGNGTYKLYAFGVDQEGNTATIGTKTVAISNNSATKPFGSIDTPAIGGDASGPNFGWGLTPKVNGAATCKIQASGVKYSIDSGPLQPVNYGDARSDIAGAFPGFSNSAGAGGNAIIDWSTLTNGSHTIGWLITDDCNRADGVGSRFFNVTTGSSTLTAPPGYFRLKAEATREEGMESVSRKSVEDGASPVSPVASAFRRKDEPVLTLTRGFNGGSELVQRGQDGAYTIEVKQGERIELRTPREFGAALQIAPDGRARALPIGSSWDAASNTFHWQPAPGFLGPFRIVFTNGTEHISVRVVVRP
jgi:Cu/Zn superoxide dismutase